MASPLNQSGRHLQLRPVSASVQNAELGVTNGQKSCCALDGNTAPLHQVSVAISSEVITILPLIGFLEACRLLAYLPSCDGRTSGHHEFLGKAILLQYIGMHCGTERHGGRRLMRMIRYSRRWAGLLSILTMPGMADGFLRVILRGRHDEQAGMIEFHDASR